jgi:hypothetical protein
MEDRKTGWPESLNIKDISKLFYPNEPSKCQALISYLKAEIENGNLPSSGDEYDSSGWTAFRAPSIFDNIPHPFDSHYSRSRHDYLDASPKTVSMISRNDFKSWESMLVIPEGSPLSGWIDSYQTELEKTKPSDQKLREAELKKFLSTEYNHNNLNPIELDIKKADIHDALKKMSPGLFNIAFSTFEGFWKNQKLAYLRRGRPKGRS